jgi:hypothetical protein
VIRPRRPNEPRDGSPSAKRQAPSAGHAGKLMVLAIPHFSFGTSRDRTTDRTGLFTRLPCALVCLRAVILGILAAQWFRTS